VRVSKRDILGIIISFDKDGHMTDHKVWNHSIAQILAKEEGIELLTERHLEVISYMRSEYDKTDVVPTLRKITKNSGIGTKEMYALYPRGPSKKAAKIGGLPKPKGCI